MGTGKNIQNIMKFSWNNRMPENLDKNYLVYTYTHKKTEHKS